MPRFDPGAYNDDIYFEGLRKPVLARRPGVTEGPTVASTNRLFPAYGLRTNEFREAESAIPQYKPPTPTTTSVTTRGATRLGPGGVQSPYLAVGAPSRYTTPSRTTTGRLGSREGFVARREPAPEYPTEELRGISYPGFEPPGLEIPERDPSRVRALTERAFRPGASRLRTGTRRALRTAEDAPTPYARRIQARDVLAGFGEGLGRVRESATRTGLAEYEPEFRSGVEKVKGEYEAGYRGAVVRHGTEVSRREQQRQDIMNQYMANLKQWQARIGG